MDDLHIYPGVTGAFISWRAVKELGILPAHYLVLGVGLSQLCSKSCLKCFWEFPKKFPYYAQTPSYYARLC